jgi:hypothetical protein
VDQNASANYQIEWFAAGKLVGPGFFVFDLLERGLLSPVFRNRDDLRIAINSDNLS